MGSLREQLSERSKRTIEPVEIPGIDGVALQSIRPSEYFRLCDIVKDLDLDDVQATCLFIQSLLVVAETGERVYPDLVVVAGKIVDGEGAFQELCELDHRTWSPLNAAVWKLIGRGKASAAPGDVLKKSDAIPSDSPL